MGYRRLVVAWIVSCWSATGDPSGARLPAPLRHVVLDLADAQLGRGNLGEVAAAIDRETGDAIVAIDDALNVGVGIVEERGEACRSVLARYQKCAGTCFFSLIARWPWRDSVLR